MSVMVIRTPYVINRRFAMPIRVVVVQINHSKIPTIALDDVDRSACASVPRTEEAMTYCVQSPDTEEPIVKIEFEQGNLQAQHLEIHIQRSIR